MFLPTKILWMLTTFQILCLHLKYQQELPHCCLSPTQKFSCFQPSKTLFFLCMNGSTCRKETIQSYNLFSTQKAFDWWSICRYWLIYFQHFYTKWGVGLDWNKNCLRSVVCGSNSAYTLNRNCLFNINERTTPKYFLPRNTLNYIHIGIPSMDDIHYGVFILFFGLFYVVLCTYIIP